MGKFFLERQLKVEAIGHLQLCRGRRLVPRIRIMGRWLEAAGFPPDSRVLVVCAAPGQLVLTHSPELIPAPCLAHYHPSLPSRLRLPL